MVVLKCICGNLLFDTCESDGEAFTEDQGVSVTKIGEFEDEYYPVGEGRDILECEKCGALAIEDPLDSAYVKYYLPESKKFNGLFKRT
jgi:hypothetical protein